MRNMLLTLFVAVLAGTILLYIEYCWFGEGCAVNSVEAKENIRGPDKKLISDSPIINYSFSDKYFGINTCQVLKTWQV